MYIFLAVTRACEALLADNALVHFVLAYAALALTLSPARLALAVCFALAVSLARITVSCARCLSRLAPCLVVSDTLARVRRSALRSSIWC